MPVETASGAGLLFTKKWLWIPSLVFLMGSGNMNSLRGVGDGDSGDLDINCKTLVPELVHGSTRPTMRSDSRVDQASPALVRE